MINSALYGVFYRYYSVSRPSVLDLPEDFKYDSEGDFYKLYRQYTDEPPENMTVECNAYGGGKHEVRIHVIGDATLFKNTLHQLKLAAGFQLT